MSLNFFIVLNRCNIVDFMIGHAVNTKEEKEDRLNLLFIYNTMAVFLEEPLALPGPAKKTKPR